VTVGPVKARLVCLLIERAGDVVAYDDLHNALWPDERRRERAAACLRSHVYQLRETIGPAMILTCPGIGYVWAGLDTEKPEVR
jgi:DNA-binding winged helix-turn-helix (wHTH) protein